MSEQQPSEQPALEPINEFIAKDPGTGDLVPTSAGQAYLEETVTNTEDDVYSFSSKLSPAITAAAMARLSRSPLDMRKLILKEFTAEEGKEEDLLRRVVTGYGDDSVQQLSYVPVVVENASNVLTKQLEWGRLAAYLEQSTRYIYFDQKVDGEYRYYTPGDLPEELEDSYREQMDQIFDNYSHVVRNISEHLAAASDTPEDERDLAWRIDVRGKACDAARGLLPAATTSTVGIVGSAQAIDNMIMRLQASELPEAQDTGRQILEEVRKVARIFFERTDMEGRGLDTMAYQRRTRQAVQALARTSLHQTVEYDGQPVKLLDYTPAEELDLVAYMLHTHTNLPFKTIKDEVAAWSREDQIAAFELYMGERLNRRHKPARAIEEARYSFEVVSDYGIFRDLQRHRMVDSLEWQDLSPYLGYEVPELAEQAGLTELYHRTHELSQQLYETLKTAGYEAEAQYATLLSDRMRWKLAYNAREAFHLHELRTQPAGHAGYRKLVSQMHEEVEKVHPHLAQAMLFVNRQDDDPSMGRLEQAKRQQKKMRKLGLDLEE